MVMRTDHSGLVAAIERAINEADPLGLLEGGAPSDEYAPEIGTILPRLANAPAVDLVPTGAVLAHNPHSIYSGDIRNL